MFIVVLVLAVKKTILVVSAFFSSLLHQGTVAIGLIEHQFSQGMFLDQGSF